jgi:tetratricopeptide (TPR) repeat protein
MRVIFPAVSNTPLRQAIDDFASGRAAEARLRCEALLRHEPEHAGALHLLGLIAHGAGRLAEGTRFLRRATEAPGAIALYWLSYAELGCQSVDRLAAIGATRRAVALDPRSTLAWFCLGNLLLETGAVAESRRCFRQALELNPGFWQARASDAVASVRSGDPESGLATFADLASTRPDNAEISGRYAALLQEIGRLPEALAAAEAAQSLDPDTLQYVLRAADIEMQLARYWPAIARLEAVEPRWAGDSQHRALKAHLLRLVDQNDAAVALCNAALALGIESAELLRAHALALQLTGQEDLALATFDRAAAAPAAAQPTIARAFSDKAVLLAELGRTAEATSAFDAALRIVPTLADAWYNKANAVSHRRGDADVAAMEQLLSGPTPFGDRLLLHFALGKSHADAGDQERAWWHWQQGNALKRASLSYDADEMSAQLASIAARPLDWSICASAEGSRSSELPVFIVGMPRSGSTLIEQILASHPSVAAGGELLQLRAAFERPLPAGDPDAARTAALATADSALARLRSVSTDARRIVDKDLANFQHLGAIHQTFPRARIIHCRRDPLETCFSAYTKLFVGAIGYAYRLDELGRYYRDYAALMHRWRSSLPPQSLLEVDYERLVREPDTEIPRLIDFLGLPWDDACARFYETRRRVGTSSFAQVRRPIYATSLYRSAGLRAHLGPLVAALGDLART